VPDKRSAVRSCFALALLAVLGVLAALGLRPGEPAGADAPPGEFSATRAIAHLDHIAADRHPTGSPANVLVRDYLLAELRGLGLEPSTDSRVAGRGAGSRLNVAGSVTNIHARLPGTAPTGRILLAAHYDSVPNGPGAADDGANIASILEIVRGLKTSAPLRNDLDIVFTDGEEAGLLGARGLVDAGGAGDPDRTVVLNMEARGTSGPAIMFQAVGSNAGLMSATGAGDALATSVSDDVYRLLPNDTDLTVFAEAGLRGLNFAFVEDSANYHTPHDDAAHLSSATVQDMGEAVMAAARELGDADLGTPQEGNHTYFTLLGMFVHYPVWLVVPLALIALLAFGLSLWYHRRHGARLGRVGLSAATFVLPIAVAGGLGLGVWQLLRLLRPEYSLFLSGDTYRPLYYAIASSLLALVVLLVWYRWIRRRASVAEVAFAVLTWFAVLAVVAAFLVPGGAYLFTWPLLIGSGAMAATRRWAPAGSPLAELAAGAASVPAVLLGLPVILLLFPLVGISLAAIPMAVTVLFGATAVGFLATAMPPRWLTVATVVAVIASAGFLGAGLLTDRYDAYYPRPVSLGYGMDGTTGRAYWLSAGNLAEPVVARMLAEPADVAPEVFPNLASREVVGSDAPPSASIVLPTLRTLGGSELPDGSRQVSLRLGAGPAVDDIAVYADVSAHEIIGATVNGVTVSGGKNVEGTDWQWGLRYTAPPADGIELTINVRGNGPLRLNAVARYNGLPADAGAPTLPEDASWAPPLANQSFAARVFEF